jgi:pimeloyl-ACP methyl ester carboxylesterase
MTEPHSRIFDSSPRLHFLEWNSAGGRTIVLLHGNSANAWWWNPVASLLAPGWRLIAIDQRGHGDSEWVRPAAYSPEHYATDLASFIEHHFRGREKPIVVGHSMGGLSVMAFARRHPRLARAAVVIDSALTSSRGRDRYLRRLKSLPVVTYPDLETAKARFRLMPDEGRIPREIVHEVAAHSLARTEDGRWTLKFDRDAFFGGDGIHAMETLEAIRIPTLLVRAEHSRIMTAEAAEQARERNPHARLLTIPRAHHHVLLEDPAAVAKVIEDFAASIG